MNEPKSKDTEKSVDTTLFHAILEKASKPIKNESEKQSSSKQV